MAQDGMVARMPVGAVEGQWDTDPIAPPPLDQAPPPPPHLDGDAAQEWRRVAAAAVALGSLRACDLPALALLAETLGLARAAQRALLAEGFAIATAAGNPKGNPAARVLAEARQHAAQMLKDFGLTPSSRGQVGGWPSRAERDADREWAEMLGSVRPPPPGR
jgi:P27 family predicted phage terminase small subunit